MSLKDDAVKLQVIKLDDEGYSQRDIENMAGVKQSTLSDFLCKSKTHLKWWAEYDSFKALNLEDLGNVKPNDMNGGVKFDVKQSKLPRNDSTAFKIETTVGEVADDCTHFVIPDTQVKPNISLDYLKWVGEYIVNRKPDVIVHLGDHADMESLSSYDKGRRSAEGKRVQLDIDAAKEGMVALLTPLYNLQQEELSTYGEVRYKPRMVLTLGNHEQRIERHVDANPELHGFLSYDSLGYKDFGWEVYDFLKPVIVNGVSYVHYMANPMSGKPYGGMAMNVLKNVGESFTQGHKQTLDVATRFLPASGKQQWAIIAGACYVHEEAYKGHQGNYHWRGVIVKHNVAGGSYNPMFVDLNYLMERYG